MVVAEIGGTNAVVVPWFSAVVVLVLFFLVHLLYKCWTLDSDLGTHFSTIKPAYFDKRLVWITGASSGIGRQLALSIASVSNCAFVLSARNEKALTELQSEINKVNAKCTAFVLPLDLRTTAKKYYENKHQQILETFPTHKGVDILVHGAGYSMRCVAMDLPIEKQTEMIQVMLTSPIILSNLVLASMKAKRFGHIAVISSFAAIGLCAIRTTYAAAKAGVAAFHECLSFEVKPFGIQVTNIFPGYVRTNVDVNSLKSGGQLSGKKDAFIQSGMSVKRCAHLILCAMSGAVAKSWISQQPMLATAYVLQHCAGFIADFFRQLISRKFLEAHSY